MAAGACVKPPELSSKVPALPTGTPCAKVLYTISSVPNVHLDYISPLEPPALADALGVVPTSFSLEYIDVKIGTGELASLHKYYSINYTGYLLDGTKFDSSFDRNEPITIPYGEHKVIPGWDTGFAGMHVGGKRRLFIPYQLAYGANGSGPIPPKSELVFDVELVSVSDTPPPPPAPPVAARPPTGAPAGAPAAAPGRPAAAPATSAPASSAPAAPAAANPAKP